MFETKTYKEIPQKDYETSDNKSIGFTIGFIIAIFITFVGFAFLADMHFTTIAQQQENLYQNTVPQEFLVIHVSNEEGTLVENIQTGERFRASLGEEFSRLIARGDTIKLRQYDDRILRPRENKPLFVREP